MTRMRTRDGTIAFVLAVEDPLCHLEYASGGDGWWLLSDCTPIERRRARNADGTYLADDPTTAGNEAWEQ